MSDLFGVQPATRMASMPGTSGYNLDHTLDQYFTPTWAAEWLVHEFFPDLGPTDFVVDAGCGHGAFLGSIPAGVPAIGVEIDATAAEIAGRNTGRLVLNGDFAIVDLPATPSVILGNPPFRERLLDGMLARAHSLLRRDGKVGWVLPSYVFQTPSRVLRMAAQWSIAHKAALPRTLYRGLKEPLCFVIFTRDGRRLLQGFCLYREVSEVGELTGRYREILERAPRSAWLRCVLSAMAKLGGRATLGQLYEEIGGAKPSATTWWREKVRQIVQRHLTRIEVGTYAISA